MEQCCNLRVNDFWSWSSSMQAWLLHQLPSFLSLIKGKEKGIKRKPKDKKTQIIPCAWSTKGKDEEKEMISG